MSLSACSVLLFLAVLGILCVALTTLRIDPLPVKLPVEPVGLGLGAKPSSVQVDVHGFPFLVSKNPLRCRRLQDASPC